MRNLKPLEMQAISNVMAELDKSPQQAAEFLIDVSTLQHRKWNIFQTELGKVNTIHFKGRATPKKKPNTKFNTSFKFGSAYVREKTQPGYFRTMKFDGQTRKQKFHTVVHSDIQMAVKEEYLTDLVNHKL